MVPEELMSRVFKELEIPSPNEFQEYFKNFEGLPLWFIRVNDKNVYTLNMKLGRPSKNCQIQKELSKELFCELVRHAYKCEPKVCFLL